MMAQQRIAYVDFMKCLCIMLIVMYHIDHEFFNYLAPNLNNALQAFRLPMYYFISGYFFKLYGGFNDFTRRKVNNILVPFVFFVVLAFVAHSLEALLRRAIGAEPITVSFMQLLEPFYRRHWEMTGPLWFLLSLFWVNVIFYLLQRYIKPRWGIVLATAIISIVGYALAASKIQLPWMLDTSLVALPYFLLGWAIKRLNPPVPSTTRQVLSRVGLLVVVAIPIYFLSDYLNLHYQILPDYWKLYLLPFVAITALFLACMALPHIPLLCHYGRYSLIILGTHQVLFLPVRMVCVLRLGMEPGIALTLIVFIVTMAMEWPVIWSLKTYAPRFTAQQPFFKPGWRCR